MKIQTKVYGSMDMIEMWGKSDDGREIKTINTLHKNQYGEVDVDIYVGDEQVARSVSMSDVGNELDYLNIVKTGCSENYQVNL